MDIEKKSGYREPTGTLDSNGRKVTRVYVIKNNDTSDDMELRILAELELLGIYRGAPISAAYPTIIVDTISIETTDGEVNFHQWEATVNYVPLSTIVDPATPVSGGFDTDLQVSGRIQQYEIALDKAYDGSGKKTIPVQSTTNEPLIGLTEYRANAILDISYNIGNFDFTWLKTFPNTTNAATVTLAGTKIEKEKARILDINPQSQIAPNGDSYYRVTVSIEVTNSDFLIRPMNTGFKGATQDSDELYYILKKDVSAETGETGEERIDEPAKLGAADSINAAEGASNALNKVITDATADYLKFKIYKPANWNPLQIPSENP